ncbi:MAG: aldo/keto reductase [Pseudonocardiaceae bacterium]
MSDVPTLTLNNGARIPQLGFGTFQVPPEDTERVVSTALECPATLRALHAEHAIATEAWSPLAQGQLLSDPPIARLAERHGVTPAQVVLRWHLRLGNIVIPKSGTPARMRENFDVFGFELSADDLAAIADLETGQRIGPDPAEFNLR